MRKPTYAGFIEIPGNTDFELQSNRLLVDSLVDLVELELKDQVVTVHRRWENLFPANPLQACLGWRPEQSSAPSPSSRVVVAYTTDQEWNYKPYPQEWQDRQKYALRRKGSEYK